jgi:hypothetical protein
MPYVLFHDHFPEIADRETRMITVFEGSSLNLPEGHYCLFEMYCNEPGCDCRRVFLSVVSSFRKDVEAVVAYGWETAEFYIKWIGDNNPVDIRALQGPVLNIGSPQSDLAPAILDMVENLVLQNEVYVQRLKNHYKMFRDKIDRKGSRALRRKRTRHKKKNR